MSTQTLQYDSSAIVIDECSSLIERILVRAARTVAAQRIRRAQRAQLQTLGELSAAQLCDIGLDDPQVQRAMYGAYIDSGREDLESLRNRMRIQR